ncbi:MAG: serine/threonine protein phosphatase [Bacteroidales bacterium]|nr:serine/threonine protein phosphatase [Bacteroidales bacterium]
MSKTWIIPDLHGCSDTLKLVIEKQIKPDSDDRLVFLGDYIDRGPDSKGVIDYILELQKNGQPITALKGNHESVCVKAYYNDRKKKPFLGVRSKTRTQKEWEQYGGGETLKSFGVKRPGDIPHEYIDWMNQLDYFADLGKYVAVHAGFNFDLDDPYSDTSSMIWIRDYRVIPEKIDNKVIIHGHVPVNLEFIDMTIKNKNTRLIDLDNGIYVTNQVGYGNLVVLELLSMEYKIQTTIDKIQFSSSS